MFGLVIIHHQAGVNDAGDPAEQRQRDTQEEAEDAASHQDGHGRKDNAKEIAQGFHRDVESLKALHRYIVIYAMNFVALLTLGNIQVSARTISAGVPGTAMPANQLTTDEIWQIVAYLRTLEQPVAATNGDQRRGEALFFGAARCSSCHIVNGRGGRLGPELSTVGSARSRAYIVESIREPGRQLTQNRAFGDDVTLKYDTVTAVTADGRTIVGVPMNEDTFTVQLMDTSERVHSLDKKTLKSVRHENRSLMPAYDASRLSNADLDNLVAYLQSLRTTSSVPKGGSDEE